MVLIEIFQIPVYLVDGGPPLELVPILVKQNILEYLNFLDSVLIYLLGVFQ